MRSGGTRNVNELKDPTLNATLRVGAAALVPALLAVVLSVPVWARDFGELAGPQPLEGRWIDTDGQQPPLPEDVDAEAPLPEERQFDLRWIDRLNAHPAGRRGKAPGVLPILPRFGAGPGWRAAGRPHLPAEFEPQEALVLPVGLLAEEAPEALAGLVAATRHRTAVVGIVANAAQRARVEQELRAKGLPATGIQFTEMPHNTKWLRDYGPIFVRLHNNRRAALDAEYPESGREDDDDAPGKLAGRFHADVIPVPIVFEGGNLLTNGHGLCLTTTAAIFRNSDQQDAEARVLNVFRDCFGSTQTVFLEPLMGEPTGHVDMFACFTAPNVVVVGSYSPAADPLNAAVLDRNAARLGGLATASGPLRVVRVPMPPHQDGNWRTYTNIVFANSVVLVPTYRGVDRAGREKALETFARLMPGWKVIGIDSTNLIQGGGALRCITTGVPLAPPRAAPVLHRALQGIPRNTPPDGQTPQKPLFRRAS